VGCSKVSGGFALALAVLSRSRLTPGVIGRSKLDGIARMEAPAEIWHGLGLLESDRDGCGLREGILERTEGWAQLRRPWRQLRKFHQKDPSWDDKLLELGEN